MSIQTAVTSENWDFITFQQVSGYSGVADSYNDLVELISIVEPLCPSAKLAWHMTWAYKVGSTHSDFSKYGKDQMTMYNAITNAVNTNKLIVVDELKFAEIKTKNFANVMANLNVEKGLVVLADNDANVVLSARNMANVDTTLINTLNVYDVMKAKKVVLTKDAVAKIEEVYA